MLRTPPSNLALTLLVSQYGGMENSLEKRRRLFSTICHSPLILSTGVEVTLNPQLFLCESCACISKYSYKYIEQNVTLILRNYIILLFNPYARYLFQSEQKKATKLNLLGVKVCISLTNKWSGLYVFNYS